MDRRICRIFADLYPMSDPVIGLKSLGGQLYISKTMPGKQLFCISMGKCRSVRLYGIFRKIKLKGILRRIRIISNMRFLLQSNIDTGIT